MSGLAEEIVSNKSTNPWLVKGTVQNSSPASNPWKAREIARSNIPVTNPFIQKSRPKTSAFIEKPQDTLQLGNPISNILSDSDFNKLVGIESANSYDALNNSSKAYGRYQFIPSTAKSYASKLGIPLDQWKIPENQDKMFKAFTEDNVKQLKSYGIPITPFTIYGAHQQGAKGLSDIMSGEISEQLERNVRSNVPEELKELKGRELIDAWQNYWQQKFN